MSEKKVRRIVNAEKNKIWYKKYAEINTHIHEIDRDKEIHKKHSNREKGNNSHNAQYNIRMDHYRKLLVEERPEYKIKCKYTFI